MTGHVVVGFDGSEQSVKAVDWAADEARRRRLPLTVLHAVDYLGLLPNAMGPPGWPAVFAEDAEKVAEVGAARARDRSGDVEVAALTEEVGAARALVEASRTAALLVVGAHGRGALPGMLVGSVAFTVAGHAHCPVVIVRGDGARRPGPDRPVVVGFDGSPGSCAAMAHAADVAAESAAHLMVITAYQPVSPWLLSGSTYSSNRPDFDAAARNAARQTAVEGLRIARRHHPALPATQRAEHGPTAPLLAAAAQDAGLLVVGSRGHGGFTGLLLGSVGHRLIRVSPCPVVVVHDRTVRAENAQPFTLVSRPV